MKQDAMNLFEGYVDQFLIYKGGNTSSMASKLQSTHAHINPVATASIRKKPSRKKARFTALIHVLMVMPVMSNVALVVIAANYSQQSHSSKSLTLHSSKGTTDTQLTTSESLSTRT